MEKTVGLSPRSLELIKDYILACGEELTDLQSVNSTLKTSELVSWLGSEALSSNLSASLSKEEQEFLLASLRAQLLKDLLLSLDEENKDKTEINSSTPESTWTNKLKLVLLAASGTLLAACEGFDSVTTLLGMFTLPSVAILGAGILFSFLSIIFFYGYDLIQVSNNLGIKLTDAPKLLDTCLLELEGIKALRRKIETYNLSTWTPEELAQLNQMVSMLQLRFKEVTLTSKQFALALDSPKMKIAKHVISGVSGLLFFGGGFFAGQSVGAFIMGLVMASVVPTFWPVMIFSALVGLAAFSLYWYVERVSVSTLVSSWFGLDEEKVTVLCDESKLQREDKRLDNLKEKVGGFLELNRKIEQLQPKVETEESKQAIQELVTNSAPKRSNHQFFFSPKPKVTIQESFISKSLSAAY